MASIITNTNSVLNSTSSSSSTITNPGATLDKDAFLKLLLVELQHQDPTDPMDSDKMLTQTSQLTALEMQQNTNETMQKMVETMQTLASSFSTSMSTSSLAAIGKMASLTNDTISLSKSGDTASASFYLPEDADDNGISLEVYNSSGKLVYSQKINEGQTTSKGTFSVNWDGVDSNGVFAGSGDYTMKAIYTNQNGEKIETKYGDYLVEGITFKDGAAYAKLASGDEVSFDNIKQITNYKG